MGSTRSTDTEQLRQEIERTRDELGRDVDALAEKVTPSKIAERRMESVRSTMSDVKERVMGTASDTTHGVADAASSAASSVASTTTGTTRRVTRAARGNPLAAGLLVFAAGWVVSGLLPASEKEKELAQQATQKAKESGLLDEAGRMAREVREGMEQPLQEAADQVKQSAADAAEHVKESASGAAENVKATASERTG